MKTISNMADRVINEMDMNIRPRKLKQLRRILMILVSHPVPNRSSAFHQQRNSIQTKNLYCFVVSLGEYPSFANGATSKLDEAVSQVQTATVNPMPVIWGPQKRHH